MTHPMPCIAAALFGAAVLLATPGQAQSLIFSPLETENCFNVGGWEDECVGASAYACMQNTPGGDSTAGMSGCLGAEADYWDARLNMSYQRAMARARSYDADMGGSSAPSVAGAMQEMQRAWIGFRDGLCDFERSTWGGGSGGGPATAECLMRATAKQTLYLENALVE